PTNDKNILHIQLSPWWKYPVRRSFLTACLRAGQQFTEHTVAGFEKALYSQHYLASTKQAVSVFLGGRTACRLKKVTSQNFGGWYNHFLGRKTEEAVRQTLVRVLPEGHPGKAKAEEERKLRAEERAKKAEEKKAELAKKAEEKKAALAKKAEEKKAAQEARKKAKEDAKNA